MGGDPRSEWPRCRRPGLHSGHLHVARGPGLAGEGLDPQVAEWPFLSPRLSGQPARSARLPPQQPPSRPPGWPCSSLRGVQALSSNPFHVSGFLSGPFWWYPNFLGLTQRKKHFVKIAALLLNNVSSYSLFLFGRQKLNIDLWEREKEEPEKRGRRWERKQRRGERLGAGGRSAGSHAGPPVSGCNELRPGTRPCFCHEGTSASSLPVPKLLGPWQEVSFTAEEAPRPALMGTREQGLPPEIRRRLHSGGSWDSVSPP